MSESSYFLRLISIGLALGLYALVLSYAEISDADVIPAGSIARQPMAVSLALSASLVPIDNVEKIAATVNSIKTKAEPEKTDSKPETVIDHSRVSKPEIVKVAAPSHLNPSASAAQTTVNQPSEPEVAELKEQELEPVPVTTLASNSSQVSDVVDHTGVHDEIELKPQFRSTPQAPVYPRIARKRGQQGIVWLDIWLDQRGEQTRLEVFDSSGVSQLDRAAVQAVSQWEFVPRRIADQAVDSRVRIPVHFTLN